MPGSHVLVRRSFPGVMGPKKQTTFVSKKIVRFADTQPPGRPSGGGGSRQAPPYNLDRTRPVLYQPPLGVASCVVTPRRRTAAPPGGPPVRNQEQGQRSPAALQRDSDASEGRQDSREASTGCAHCSNCPRHSQELSTVEPWRETSEFSSEGTCEYLSGEQLDQQLEEEQLDDDDEQDDDDVVPPYYRRKVPSPLPPGYFRDARTHQVFTRETYQPEGSNPCEVRTYDVKPPAPPDDSPIYSFHPGRVAPVTNFADFTAHRRATYRKKQNQRRHAQQLSPTSVDSGLGSPEGKSPVSPTCLREQELTLLDPARVTPTTVTCTTVAPTTVTSCSNSGSCLSNPGLNQDHRSQTQQRQSGDIPPTNFKMATTVSVPNAVARLQERNDMAQLNDRLAHYITEVKHLREQAHRIDSTAFLESIKILEEGLFNLKNLYEQELDKARRYADDLSREKNHYAMQVSKHTNGLQELENRLTDEMEKNRKAQDDLNLMHRSVSEKERQLEEIQREVKEPLEELERLRRQYTDLLRENNNLKRKSEAEVFQRNEADDRSEQLIQKMDFMETVHRQETQDLNDRLAAAQENILTLEQRVRDLTRPDNLLEELVQRVRNSADHEMTMFKEESEELFQRTVTALKARIDQDARRLEELTSHNVQLTSEAGEMLAQIRSLEGQIASLDHQKRSLEEILYNERQHARGHITSLEQKLQDLNDLLILKLRELNAARDAQLPLKSEIEALKALLEEEERRLRSLPEISSLPGAPRPLHPLTSVPTCAVSTVPLTAPAYAAGVNIPNHTSTARRAPTQPAPTHPVPPLGPVRARSAPVSVGTTTPKLNLIPSNLGQGRDYFDQMFNDLKRDVIKSRQAFAATPDTPAVPATDSASTGQSPFERPGNPEPGSGPLPGSERPPSSVTHDYNTSTSSATGPIRILEVQPEGKYIRLVNTATTKEEEFGNFLLQQNVGGQPVAVYRFPPRLRFPANSTITIWSGSNDPMMHKPPTDFVFKEQTKWGTGPECTSILCKPSGQAIAWTTAAHRFTKDAFDQMSFNGTTDNTNIMKVQEELTELSPEVNGPRNEPVYLRRAKEPPPTLSPQKHPHGAPAPSTPTHPSGGAARPTTYGNDNSSVNRQSRSQSTRPDPVPGAPYAGAAAQRMGSASLRKYSGTVRSNGSIANKSEAGTPSTSRPPSSFQTPKERFFTGLEQIQSQHHSDFNPPMPRPPLFSAW